MSIRLRGHHLLCLLTYKGEGYSPAFCENYTALAARLSAGENFTIINGPDDICAALLAEDACAHCTKQRIGLRDQCALEDLKRVGLPFAADSHSTFTPTLLEDMRTAFAQNRIRSGCAGCEWHAFCTQIAEDDFAGTLLTASN